MHHLLLPPLSLPEIEDANFLNIEDNDITGNGNGAGQRAVYLMAPLWNPSTLSAQYFDTTLYKS